MLDSTAKRVPVQTSEADAHAKCCVLVALMRGYLTQPIQSQLGIHLNISEQAGLDEVFELLQQALGECKP